MVVRYYAVAEMAKNAAASLRSAHKQPIASRIRTAIKRQLAESTCILHWISLVPPYC